MSTTCRIQLITFVLILTFSPKAYSTVYVYSLNNNAGLFVVEQSNFKINRLRTFSKSPHASMLKELPFLQELFVSGSREFTDEKEIIINPLKKIVHIAYGLQRREITHDDLTLEVDYFTKGEIVKRFLIFPKLLIHDFSELFLLQSVINQYDTYNFYLLREGEPLTMMLVKEEDNKYLLKSDAGKIAYLVYNSNSVISQIDFSPCNNPILQKYTLKLRSVKESISDVGRNHVFLSPNAFKKLLKTRDLWEEGRPRSFECINGTFRYVTSRSDTYDITKHVRAALKQKLFSANVLISDRGFQNVEIVYDKDNMSFSAAISERCELRYNDDDRAVANLQDNIKNSRQEVRFDTPIWSIQNDHMLVGEVDFQYTQNVTDQTTTYPVATEETRRIFRRRHAERPDYYKYSDSDDAIIVTGCEERKFLFLRWCGRIGSIRLSKETYWDRLSEQVTRRLSCVFDSSRKSIILTYDFEEQRNGSKELRFDLSEAFENRYAIRPDEFDMERDSEGVTIKGTLSDEQSTLTSSDVRRVVNRAFSRSFNCFKENWNIVKDNGRFHVTVVCHQRMALDKSVIKGVLDKEYDIIEDPEYRLTNPTEIKCSFWGFKKKGE
jgi:hypothetical protein